MWVIETKSQKAKNHEKFQNQNTKRNGSTGQESAVGEQVGDIESNSAVIEHVGNTEPKSAVRQVGITENADEEKNKKYPKKEKPNPTQPQNDVKKNLNCHIHWEKIVDI